jgi:hypothetical protein
MPVQDAAAMDANMGLIRRAMAFRVKYRVPNADGSQKRCMALAMLGVHPQNRGGVYPSPETVQNLGVNLLTSGFNADEANHEGVCVQELPVSEQTTDPLDPDQNPAVAPVFRR